MFPDWQMKAPRQVAVKVVGHYIDGDQRVDVLGVVALQDIPKGTAIYGTEFYGKCLFREQWDTLEQRASSHVRQLQHPNRRTVRVIGQTTDQRRDMGSFINCAYNRKGKSSNVNAPATVGQPHTSKRVIAKGEELLVGYGPQTAAIINGGEAEVPDVIWESP